MTTTAFQASEFPAMGWHSSSWDLRQGLEVTEMPFEALPSDMGFDAGLYESLQVVDLNLGA